jgi:hypothetical protein
MNSPTANLFLSLQAKIAALADGDNKKYFSYIDQDLGQLEYQPQANRPPVSWPCILIDVDDEEFTDLASNVQSGTGRVIIRLGFPPFSPSTANTPQQFKEKAIYFYDLEQVLYEAIHGWNPGDQAGYESLSDIFGHFMRRRAVTEKREDFLRVRQITYEIGFQDYTAKPAQQFAPAAISITSEWE